MVARQHVERVGDLGRALLQVDVVGERVLQVGERLQHRLARHVVVLLAGPRQEVGDVGIEPHVAGARRPQAEAAGRRLVVQHAVDGVLDAAVQVGILRQAGGLGQLGDIEQRHGAAGRLLGAAIGVAVERHHQRRHVEGRRLRDADADESAVEQAGREQLAVDLQAAAVAGEVDHEARGDRQDGRTHRDRQRSARPSVRRPRRDGW